MKFYFYLLLSASISHTIFAKENSDQEYNNGCYEASHKNPYGKIVKILCFDKQLNKSVKFYLNEKFITEIFPDSSVNDQEVFEKDKKSKKLISIYRDFRSYSGQVRNVIIFNSSNKNSTTSHLEKTYYIFNFLNNSAKLYKFTMSNVDTNAAIFYVENDVLIARLNSEIVLKFEKDKVSYPTKIMNREKFTENIDRYKRFRDEFKNMSDAEVYAYFQPRIEEYVIDTQDPLVKSKVAKTFEITKDGFGRIKNEIDTPLGKWIISSSNYVEFYSKEAPKIRVLWVDPDSIGTKFPGVLAVNENKTLILTYLSYDGLSSSITCGKRLALFDFTGKEMAVSTFGVSLGCDIFKSVKFIGDNEAIVKIEPNLEFHYKDGKMTLPGVKDYAVYLQTGNYYVPRDKYEIYNKEYESNKIKKLKNNRPIIDSGKTSAEIYEQYRPYFMEEGYPLIIPEHQIINTELGEIIIENSRNFWHKVDTSTIYLPGKVLLRSLYTGIEESSIFQVPGKYYLGSIWNYVDYDGYWTRGNQKCASDGFLIDITNEEPVVYTFGSKNACNKIASINYENDKLEILMDNDQKYYYSEGEFTLPKASKSYSLKFQDGKTKKGVSLYKAFPPYANLVE